MASATTMYYSEKNPLHQVTYKSEKVQTAKSPEHRRLHKAFLRWHDPKNWPLLRQAIDAMGWQELIGDGVNQLIPHYKKGEEALEYVSYRHKNSDKAHQKRVEAREQAKQSSPATSNNSPKSAKTGQKGSTTQTSTSVQGSSAKGKPPQKGTILTQHTGLPPKARADFGGKGNPSPKHKPSGK